jgi:putative glycosyltransferase
MPLDEPRYSIVATLYCSAPFLDEFVARCLAVGEQAGGDFELILVDDGSPDDALPRAIAMAARDPRIRVAELSRNFGHHAAVLTGMRLARGEFVFLVDSDLEEEPELLLTFKDLMEKSGADVVFGVHEQKSGTVFRRFTSGSFWRLFNALSETRTVENICNVRLMNRRYVDALLSLPERNIFLGGMFAWPGFYQLPAMVNRQLRREVSTYNLLRRIALMGRSIVAFSTKPLVLIFSLGVSICVLSILMVLFFVAVRLLVGTQPSGFTAIVVSIWFLGGLILASLGTLGLYIAHIYTEAKGRPVAIIRRIYEASPAKASP